MNSVVSETYPDEIEFHYEQKLRDIFFQSTSNRDGIIQDETEWQIMTAMLIKNRLLSTTDDVAL
jgi:hypothetical protein